MATTRRPRCPTRWSPRSFRTLAGNETNTTFSPNFFSAIVDGLGGSTSDKYTGILPSDRAEASCTSDCTTRIARAFTRRHVVLPAAPRADVRINGACVTRTDNGQARCHPAPGSSADINVSVHGLPPAIDTVRFQLDSLVLEHQVDPSSRIVASRAEGEREARAEMILGRALLMGSPVPLATVALDVPTGAVNDLPRANISLDVRTVSTAGRVVNCTDWTGAFALLTARHDRLYLSCTNAANFRPSRPWTPRGTWTARSLLLHTRPPGPCADGAEPTHWRATFTCSPRTSSVRTGTAPESCLQTFFCTFCTDAGDAGCTDHD